MNDYFLKILGVVAAVFLFLVCTGTKYISAQQEKGRLVWSDEFNYNGNPDSTKWSYDIGDGCPSICGWGNNELQYYTSHRLENARVENGNLIIEAVKENIGSREYSSCRLVSRQKGDWTYGRIEVRARLPKGLGVWPAIWMLPTERLYGDWPAFGEIDIMENVGYIPDSIYSTVHTKRFSDLIGAQVSKGVASSTLSSDFHTYSLDWDAEKIDFFFDEQLYQTFHNRHEGPDAWPFDHDFHLLMNIAVGGNWGGKKGVDPSIWPQKMQIDYVRVYQL